jgi:hypothetical protein
MTKGMTWAASPIEHLARRLLWLGLELRPPIAERLERYPVSLAILSLIEFAFYPGHMMRPPNASP